MSEALKSLILTFGEDFDLIAGVAEVAATTARCADARTEHLFSGGLPVVAESLEALARRAS